MCLSDRLGIALGVSCRQRIVSGWAIAVLGSLLALASSNDALATNGTWTRTTSGGLWSAIADWSGGTVATGTDGIANFGTLNLTADITVHLDSARTIGGLLFGDTTPSNDWILDNNNAGGNVLTLAVSSGSPSIQVNNDTATISAVLAGTQGLTKKGAGTLFLAPGNTFSGGLSIQQGTLGIVTINNVGANGSLGHNTSVGLGANGQTGTLEFAGSTASSNMPFTLAAFGTGSFQVDSSGTNLTLSGAISGSGTLTKSGAGRLTLSGANTYTTPTTVNGGTLQSANSGALATTSAVTVSNAGSTLAVNYGGASDYTEAQVATLLGKTTFGAGTALGFDTTNAGGTASYGNAIATGITKLGPGTLTLTASNTYTGATTINAGILQEGISGAFGNNSAVSLANVAGAALDVTGFDTQIGSLTGGGANGGNVTLGAATLTVGGDNTSPTAYEGSISGTGALTKIGSGALTLSGANGYAGPTTINGGTLQSANDAALATTTSVAVSNAGSMLVVNYGGPSDYTQTQVATLLGKTTFAAGTAFGFDTTNAAGAVTYNNAISIAAGITKLGSGTLTLSGANTYMTPTTINGGTLQSPNNNALATTSSVSVNNAGSTLAVNYGGPSDYTEAQVATLLGKTTFGAGTAFGFDTSNAVGAVTYDNAISIAAGITKLGSGALTLSGANVYTGPTTINGGTLQSANDAVLATTASVAVNNAGSMLAVNYGGPSDYAETQVATLLGKTTFAAGTEFGFDTTNAAGAVTYGNAISTLAGGITKLGPGTLTLSGANTYTGTTTISGGTLRSVNNGALATTSAVTVNNAGSTLVVNYGGASDYTQGQVATLLGKTTFGAGTAFAFDTTNASGPVTYGDAIAIAAGIMKLGPGTLTLSGVNTYTGPTSVNAGILKAGIGGAFGNNSAVSLADVAGAASTSTDSTPKSAR